MNCRMGTIGRVTAICAVLMTSSGCGIKWLQSDGAEQAESRNGRTDSANGATDGSGQWQGLGVNPNFPDIARENLHGGELSGFSSNPAEERLASGYAASPRTYAGMNVLQHAELTKEERAAIDAGLQDVFFGYDQWTLSENGMASLNHDAAWLKQHPGALLKVEGHCDERGTTDYNVVLGDKRAKSARIHLIELGVNPKQVAIVSYGKERPFCQDHTETCYQQNRRGHVLLKLKK